MSKFIKNRRMKNSIIFIVLLLFLCAVALVNGAYAYNQYETYQIIETEIAKLNEEKSIVIDNNVSFINTHDKFNFTEIENKFYYGYENLYIKDDIRFISMLKSWDEEKLETLADELYANAHGDEIDYVEKVVIYESSGIDATGSHSQSIYNYELPVSFYNFLPEELMFDALYKRSTINIYGVEDDTAIKDLALVLSHEYGHHYTFYYFGIENNEDDTETQYYKLRSQDSEIILDRESYDDYIDNHKWYLAEIAAEDYVYLMGSENTKKTLEFYDSSDTARMFNDKGRARPYELKIRNPYCINAIPHENSAIPMPYAVDGLAEYFYSFIDEEVPEHMEINSIGTLNLQMEKTGENKHHFTWKQPYTDPEVIYTLIGYDMEDNIEVIVKTTNGDKKGQAYLGSYVHNPSWGFNYYEHYGISIDFGEGTEMKFRVSITFPDGTVYLSEPLVIEY